jgi:hypothetical protein
LPIEGPDKGLLDEKPMKWYHIDVPLPL